MKQDVFDILIYLFENYMYDDGELDQDQDSLRVELQEAGFGKSAILKAFDWLEGLTNLPQRSNTRIATSAVRVYSERECERLDTDCRGFLMFLEQMGVLDHDTRELILDRVMELNDNDVDLDQLKWVILMVLFNQPGQEAAVAWMEDIVLDEMPSLLH